MIRKRLRIWFQNLAEKLVSKMLTSSQNEIVSRKIFSGQIIAGAMICGALFFGGMIASGRFCKHHATDVWASLGERRSNWNWFAADADQFSVSLAFAEKDRVSAEWLGLERNCLPSHRQETAQIPCNLGVLAGRFFVEDFANLVKQCIRVFVLSNGFTFLQSSGGLIGIDNAQNWDNDSRQDA